MQAFREHRFWGWWRNLRVPRSLLVSAALVLAACLTVAWFVRLAVVPERRAGQPVVLADYGLPGVQVHIVYPVRLGAQVPDARPETITIVARALSADDVTPFRLHLALPDDSAAFVDVSGRRVPGYVDIEPGYPSAMPYDLEIAYGDTQYRAGLFAGHVIPVTAIIEHDGAIADVPDLSFEVILEGRWARGLRHFAARFTIWVTPLAILGLAILASYGFWRRIGRRRRLDRERQLAAIYTRIREQIKLEQWSDARREIDQIRLLAPKYRDIDQIESQVSSAETASWRREQLYSAGASAYRERDWPAAVRAFGAVEEETPYYRDARFLGRTAALYADLTSRDRSLRVRAAEELGEVGDLLDMYPLLDALGDPSQLVADAAEKALGQIGPQAVDALLAGLGMAAEATRERCYRLLKAMGPGLRPDLIAALRSSDVSITASASRLLVELGARRELAQALLDLPMRHLEGVVQALVNEHGASYKALVEALLRAPADRQQIVVNALAALKVDSDIDDALRDEMRATHDKAHRALLQRALDADPAPFYVGDAREQGVVVREQPRESEPPKQSGPKGLIQRLRLLDRYRT